MEQIVRDKFNRIAPMISHTPLLEIKLKYKGEERVLYAKAEYYNLSGSIKDRVAFYVLKKAYEEGTIQSTDKIVEATSGNTGISFSALGSYLGHDVTIYIPDWMSIERINIMKSYGANVRLVSREEGGFQGSIALTEELAKRGGVFLPKQFSNEDNTMAHYLTTGEEIIEQLANLGKRADGVVAGVGTGGTIMGIGRRLRDVNPECQIYPLEPANSPTISTGYKVGRHRIEGISDEFVPPILHMNEVSGVISVDDGDAILMAQMISRKLGIGVGISSGANLIGSLMLQNQLGKDSTIVTVFADDNKKYISTDYTKEQEMREDYITKDIELLGVTAYRYEI